MISKAQFSFLIFVQTPFFLMQHFAAEGTSAMQLFVKQVQYK